MFFLEAGDYEVTAVDMVLTYDAQKLQAISIVPGPLLALKLAGGTAADGRAAITVASGTTPAHSDGIVAVLTFLALGPGEASISVEPSTQAAAVGYTGDILRGLRGVMVRIQ